MTSKSFSRHVQFPSCLLLMTLIGAANFCAPSLSGAQSKQATAAASSAQQPAADVRGTWSGTFFSKHTNVAPFTMTVVINPDSGGHLIGSSTLSSNCLKGMQLEVSVTGLKVVLAGSDEEGDNITVRGTVDKTGALLKASYILNGSASGRCETDSGTASLARQ
jgi:hypothetical protein